MYYMATEYTHTHTHQHIGMQYTSVLTIHKIRKAERKRREETIVQRACENNLLYVKGSCADELSAVTERKKQTRDRRQREKGYE